MLKLSLKDAIERAKTAPAIAQPASIPEPEQRHTAPAPQLASADDLATLLDKPLDTLVKTEPAPAPTVANPTFDAYIARADEATDPNMRAMCTHLSEVALYLSADDAASHNKLSSAINIVLTFAHNNPDIVPWLLPNDIGLMTAALSNSYGLTVERKKTNKSRTRAKKNIALDKEDESLLADLISDIQG